MERIAMSQEERDDLDWLKRAKDGSISQREAAKKMGVSDRWVRTLLKRMNQQGDAVVVHGLRGTALQSQASGQDTEAGHENPDAARLARFWANLRRRNGIRYRSAKRPCAGG